MKFFRLLFAAGAAMRVADECKWTKFEIEIDVLKNVRF